MIPDVGVSKIQELSNAGFIFGDFSMTEKLRKWLRWYSSIEEDVRGILSSNRMHHELIEIVKANSDLPETSDLYGHLGATYTSHALIGLRRQIKIRDSMSLAALLDELSHFPHELSREYFLSLYKGYSVEGMADTDFLQFANEGADYIDADRVSKDLKHLRNSGKKCEDYADRRVAHIDSRRPRHIPSYSELDKAIQLLDQLCVKYKLLLQGSAPQSLLATKQYDWTRVLQVPWVKRPTK